MDWFTALQAYKLNIENLYSCTSYKEDDCFFGLFEQLNLTTTTSICIDITGFIRPHFIFFIIYLHKGIKKMIFYIPNLNITKTSKKLKFLDLLMKLKLSRDVRYYILGIPSLQPDMYQESVLNLSNSRICWRENRQICSCIWSFCYSPSCPSNYKGESFAQQYLPSPPFY